jgi:hypothetical protein
MRLVVFMRPWLFAALAVAAVSIFSRAAYSQLPTPAKDDCKAYYTLAPLDQSVLALLGNPVVPLSQSAAANQTLREFRNWDFPAKVTAWQERPSAEELARRQKQLLETSTQNRGQSGAATLTVSTPYYIRPMSSDTWRELEKWFAKNGPKKFPGMCVDRERAAYVLSVGVISDGSIAGNRQGSATNRLFYERSGMAREENSSLGRNAETIPGSPAPRADEFSGLGESSSQQLVGAYTCAYVYRVDLVQGKKGTRRTVPEYYYCKADSVMPKTALTTMLKFLAKAN